MEENAKDRISLAWNSTRHEQREGRVDRYGQSSPQVRALTYYGIDNQIDGVVFEVLLRKHKAIRNSLGVSIPMPVDSEQVLMAVFKGMLLKSRRNQDAPTLFDDLEMPEEVDLKWESATEREKQSRTLFAQNTIKVEDVVREINAARQAVGNGVDVSVFFRDALLASGAVVSDGPLVTVDLTETPRVIKERLGLPEQCKVRFDGLVQRREIALSRSHPAIEGLANHVLNAALDPQLEGPARRCGVIRTSRVNKRTTLLLLRHRFHIVTRTVDGESALLAEDCEIVAFAGSPARAEWLSSEAAELLPLNEPEANVPPEVASEFLQKVIDDLDSLRPKLAEFATKRAEILLDAHTRVRAASRIKGGRARIERQDTPDILGIFIQLPKS